MYSFCIYLKVEDKVSYKRRFNEKHALGDQLNSVYALSFFVIYEKKGKQILLDPSAKLK